MQKVSIMRNQFRQLSLSFSTASRPPLKPISASVAKNLESLENKDGFVPGHQHHQHGMTTGGGFRGEQAAAAGGGGGYLLNGSRTVNGQRPSAQRKPIDVTVMAQRDARR